MKNKFDAIKEIKYDFAEYFNKDEVDSEEFCKVLALCHAAKTRRKKKGNDDSSEGVSLTQDYMKLGDETILNFARKCGCSFEAALKYGPANAYKILNLGKLEYYQVLGINYSTSKRQRFSIVFRNEPLNIPSEEYPEKATLYIRGTYETMKDILLLKECEKETLKEMTESFTQLGYMTIVYGKKELSREETENYTKLMIIYKSSLTMEDYEAEKNFSTFEENITFLSMICMETKLEEGSSEMIQALKEAKIKTSLLSGSDFSQTLVAAYKSGIISSDQELYHLTGENFETVLFGIKTMLHKMKKVIHKYVEIDSSSLTLRENTSSKGSDIFLNYFLLFSAKTFSVILENNYLYSHFLFVLHLSSGVIGYHFDQKGKKKILKMVKDNFIDKPGILTVGFSFSDIEMFKKSSLAIEYKIHKNLCSYSGDLILSDKRSIIEILFHEAFVHKERVYFVISNMVHLSFLLSWPTLFSFLLNDPLFYEFLKEEWLCKFIFLLSFINVAIIATSFDKNEENLNKTTFPFISHMKKKNENAFFSRLILDKFLTSIIDSLYLFIIWSYYQNINEQEILVPSLFLPKILQFNSFINFSIIVKS